MSTKSSIPTSCVQVESTVLQVPLSTAWNAFFALKLETLAPGQVKSTTYESGGPGTVGAVLVMTYTDQSVWRLRVTEISERNHTVAYEVLSTEPAHNATSVQGELVLQDISCLGHTFVRWTTEFSNDADLTVIADQKYKKQEFFKDAAQHLK